MSKAIFFVSILTLIILAAGLPAGEARAENLRLDCDSQSGCDICDAVALIAQISRFILSIVGSLALLFFIIGGLMMLISQGGSELVNQGKNILLASVFGVIIVFLAWGIINFLIAGLTGQIGAEIKVAQLFGKPWNEIECVRPTKPAPPEAPPAAGEQFGYCAGVTIDINEAGDRCNDASPSLKNLLNCLWQNNKNNLPLTITSISSKDYGFGPGCEKTHSVNSCHCQAGGSKAVDLRSNGYTNTMQAELAQIAAACQGRFLAEIDHFHISTGDCRTNY